MDENLLIEAALENAETLVETVTDSEILKAIPVVGTALKVIKGAREACRMTLKRAYVTGSRNHQKTQGKWVKL